MDSIFNKYKEILNENKRLKEKNKMLEKRIKIYMLVQLSSSVLLILFIKNGYKNKS